MRNWTILYHFISSYFVDNFIIKRCLVQAGTKVYLLSSILIKGTILNHLMLFSKRTMPIGCRILSSIRIRLFKRKIKDLFMLSLGLKMEKLINSLRVLELNRKRKSFKRTIDNSKQYQQLRKKQKIKKFKDKKEISDF